MNKRLRFLILELLHVPRIITDMPLHWHEPETRETCAFRLPAGNQESACRRLLESFHHCKWTTSYYFALPHTGGLKEHNQRNVLATLRTETWNLNRWYKRLRLPCNPCLISTFGKTVPVWTGYLHLQCLKWIYCAKEMSWHEKAFNIHKMKLCMHLKWSSIDNSDEDKSGFSLGHVKL